MHSDTDVPEETGNNEGEHSDDTIVVPIEIRNLELSGVRFTLVSKHAFASTGLKSSINKSLSVYFTVDTAQARTLSMDSTLPVLMLMKLFLSNARVPTALGS